MLQESAHILEILVASWAFVVIVTIEILVGCIAVPGIVVDISETDAGRAGSLFQVQDHGGFGHKGAIARKAFDTLLAVNELMLLGISVALKLRFTEHGCRQFQKENNIHILD